MKTLSTFLKATALAALLMAGPAFASETINPALKDKITAKLTAEGYDVRKVQMEDGKFEVYAVKDGKTMELYLDDRLNVMKTGGEDSEDAEGSEG
jgi:coenzyme F420-reducing hydrogenase beta subunit